MQRHQDTTDNIPSDIYGLSDNPFSGVCGGTPPICGTFPFWIRGDRSHVSMLLRMKQSRSLRACRFSVCGTTPLISAWMSMAARFELVPTRQHDGRISARFKPGSARQQGGGNQGSATQVLAKPRKAMWSRFEMSILTLEIYYSLACSLWCWVARYTVEVLKLGYDGLDSDTMIE